MTNRVDLRYYASYGADAIQSRLCLWNLRKLNSEKRRREQVVMAENTQKVTG
ncbi:hypothetical protein [Hespellia stercorisuis]|uniref:hypothetical protein n=1 Tax=Hespellia stercorisuis TaxID=180311 RepID=UPI0013562A69|nr:hypothetical protein [Hespellia stercorisuis]